MNKYLTHLLKKVEMSCHGTIWLRAEEAQMF